jgi:hypothetical protein
MMGRANARLRRATTMDGKPMRYFEGLDWGDYSCPCGARLCTRHREWEDIRPWIEAHREHTDGTLLEEVTDDGARVYASKPAPTVSRL